MEKIESAGDAKFEAVLNRELSRILDGHASLDDCCGANPEYAEELRPLLQLALSSRAALKVDAPLSGDEVPARDKLMAHARSLNASRKSVSRLGLRPLLLASGVFLLLFAGTALAAGSAAPDSLLYPLKQRMESARTSLAMQELDQARAEAEHANNRLDELQKMMDQDKTEYSGGLLADYESHIKDASVHAAAAAAEGKDTSEVDAVIGSVRDRHDAMLMSLGIDEQDGEEDRSPDVQRREDEVDGGSGESHPEGTIGEPSGEDLNDDVGSGGLDDAGGSSGGDGHDSGYEQPDNDGYGGGDSQNPPVDNSHYETPEAETHGAEPKRDEHPGES